MNAHMYTNILTVVYVLTIRNELRFILLRIVFSICETLKKILSSSFSFSKLANNEEALA